MKARVLVIALALFAPLSAGAQPAKGDNLKQAQPDKKPRGIIFPSDYPLPREGFTRATPTAEEVSKAEGWIATQLPALKVSPDYQQKTLPEIIKRLPDYARQYFGYADAKGRRSLWVNFILNPERHEEWERELVTVRGGGHGYFNLWVDLEAATCRELRINSPK